MADDVRLLICPDASISSMTLTPKNNKKTGHSLNATIKVESLYNPELEGMLAPEEQEDVRVFRHDGKPRRGFSSVGLRAYVESGHVSFFEPKEIRKASQKPLLDLPVCEVYGFSVSDNKGIPHLSFTISIAQDIGKAAKFLAERKVYYGMVEIEALQMTIHEALGDEGAADEDPDDENQDDFGFDAGDEDGEGEEAEERPAKKKAAPKAKKKAPAKKKPAPKKKKTRERK